jgi:hypothetical protein
MFYYSTYSIIVKLQIWLYLKNFNLEGKMPDKSNLLHMYVREDVMKGILTFRIFMGIPSYP